MAIEVFSRVSGAQRIPQHGVNISSWGSSPFVLNTDAMTLSTPFDPWDAAAAVPTAATAATMRIVSVPSEGMHLNCYIAYTGSEPTAGAILVVGRTPSSSGVVSDDRLPFNDDTDFGDTGRAWYEILPISTPVLTASDQEVIGDFSLGGGGEWLDGSPLVQGEFSPNFKCTPPLAFYLAGCDQVMVFITTAVTASTKAMIVGRFIG